MIAFVRGEVAAVGLTSAVVAVGGIGLELQCTPGTLATLRRGEQVTLPSTLVVREDSLTLFGFLDDDEKQVFQLVQTASGVGPKVAQAMVAVLRPDELRRAVRDEDVKTLTRVPGIGPKGAQRIILELKDKVGVAGTAATLPDGTTTGAAGWREQVHGGLVGLGWTAKEAEKAVEGVAPQAGDAPDVGALLRAALQSLSRA
ncbi:Holliday junction DNA helicase RuvA [Nocardioides zeae]|uniref:Holliday junction branch migration complex subunit RuvA n=2 Tax=Nocardioides zeae TaxID=1457234 RepID=A0AAJ1U2G1_9ACTN|nr:Holliday junction branch migration protein RuvA [Nocardioides zeae]MDQ1103948.1 Holliday junction DNA helicase RuvA [Nocardioides zeae]MDR6176359.1 Holliday junction DNA helicase RuvA [Nocardioides zeae]MDR6210505.1 Holliday junction DNA helicase RuvA [Nocardioides zeae]